MKDRTNLIEPDRLYRPSEIANPSKMNTKGLGLLDMHYLTLLRKLKHNEFPVRADVNTQGGYKRYYIRGDILIEYTKYGSKYIKDKYNLN